MISYLLENKEWIFSGAGLFILGGFFTLIRYLLKKAKNQKDNEHKGLSTETKNSVASRFVQLFEAHGIHRNQIPRVIGHDINLVDIETDNALLPKLSEDVLNTACNLFNVKRAWLDGASSQIYPTYDFYKKPNEFVSFLERILSKTQHRISAVLLTPPKNETTDDALMLLEVTIGYIEDEPYFQYYLLHNWSISYWKSRSYLSSCVAHCWLRKICVYGLTISGSFIESISEGEKLLSFGNAGIHSLKGKKWYPEDMTIIPEKFLDGIDTELHNYGIKAGLKKWLALESQGHMSSGLEDLKTKHKFEIELKKYV